MDHTADRRDHGGQGLLGVLGAVPHGSLLQSPAKAAPCKIVALRRKMRRRINNIAIYGSKSINTAARLHSPLRRAAPTRPCDGRTPCCVRGARWLSYRSYSILPGTFCKAIDPADTLGLAGGPPAEPPPRWPLKTSPIPTRDGLIDISFWLFYWKELIVCSTIRRSAHIRWPSPHNVAQAFPRKEGAAGTGFLAAGRSGPRFSRFSAPQVGSARQAASDSAVSVNIT